MFDYIKGTVTFTKERSVTIENNGIGYFIQTPSTRELFLQQETTLYIHFYLRENQIDLYGFLTPKQRDFFLSLIGVKGLGPKSALSLLSSDNIEEVIDAINNGNAGFLQRFSGIGPKASQQIILDLRGKINLLQPLEKISPNVAQTIDALKNIGYTQTEIKKIIPILETTSDLPIGELIKIALKNI